MHGGPHGVELFIAMPIGAPTGSRRQGSSLSLALGRVAHTPPARSRMPLCAANARASTRRAPTTSSTVLSLQPLGTLVMAYASPTSALQGGWKHTPHPRRPRRAESGIDVHNHHRPGAFSWRLRICVV